LIRAPLSTSSVLDETSEAVARVAAPWAGVLLATSMPYRFMQVLFIERLQELGSSASHYGNALGRLANLTVLAFLLSLLGRAVYARAVRLSEEEGETEERRSRLSAAPLRVPPVALASYIYTAALTEVVFLFSLFTIVAVPLAIMLSALAIGTMELNREIGLRAPLRLILRYLKSSRTQLAVTLIFALSLLMVWVNLNSLAQLLLWLADVFGGVNAARWQLLMGSSHFGWLSFAGAILILEPFWVAANVVLVRKAGAMESGDELRLWFRELQA
jgi:hypothetical protein